MWFVIYQFIGKCDSRSKWFVEGFKDKDKAYARREMYEKEWNFDRDNPGMEVMVLSQPE